MELFELTKALINIESVTGHERACAEYLGRRTSPGETSKLYSSPSRATAPTYSQELESRTSS